MTRGWTLRNTVVYPLTLLLLAAGCATVGEPTSVARAWERYDARAKVLYVVGFNNGWKMAVITTSVEGGEAAAAAQQRFARFDAVRPEALVGLLDAFYTDPQNELVALDFALDLVVDRAAGIDIEPALGKAREIGLKNSRSQSKLAH